MRKKSLKPVKKTPKKYVLAIDIGGTKLALAIIDNRARVLREIRQPARLQAGPQELVNQISELAQELLLKYKPKKAFVASAGPLDPIHGRLLNPTNLHDDKNKWGVVELVRLLNKKLKIPVRLENDAAAALLAERWVGLGRRVENFAVVSLGTGVGTAFQVEGQLVRAGGHLHTEFGHIIMDLSANAPLCGCGNRGCAEALLSGVHFTQRLQKEWNEPSLTGEELVARAQANDAKALVAFQRYARDLAGFLCSIVVSFAPQRIILSGGFSNAYELFAQQLEARLSELLASRRTGVDMMPVILVSKFRDEAGLIGAASLGFKSK